MLSKYLHGKEDIMFDIDKVAPQINENSTLLEGNKNWQLIKFWIWIVGYFIVVYLRFFASPSWYQRPLSIERTKGFCTCSWARVSMHLNNLSNFILIHWMRIEVRFLCMWNAALDNLMLIHMALFESLYFKDWNLKLLSRNYYRL